MPEGEGPVAGVARAAVSRSTTLLRRKVTQKGAQAAMSQPWVLLAVVVVAIGLVIAIIGAGIGLVVTMAVAAETADQQASCPATGSGPDPVPDAGGASPPPVGAGGASPVGIEALTTEQISNARLIIGVVGQRRLPSRAAVLAITAALQESSLINLDHGDLADPSSRGLFQQIAAYGPDRVIPERATEMFLDRLVLVAGWENRPAPEVIQAVQISAHPDLYGRWEPLAIQLVAELGADIGGRLVGEGCIAEAIPGGAIGGYALPLDPSWFEANPSWATYPHHDYPAADMPVPDGTPIYAVAGGVVLTAPVGGACGAGVNIRSDDGTEWVYCHGQDGGTIVRPGDRVTPGQRIMTSGWTGHVIPPGPGGAHLHFQIGRAGRLLCPQPLLAGLLVGRPVPPSELPDAGCSY